MLVLQQTNYRSW